MVFKSSLYWGMTIICLTESKGKSCLVSLGNKLPVSSKYFWFQFVRECAWAPKYPWYAPHNVLVLFTRKNACNNKKTNAYMRGKYSGPRIQNGTNDRYRTPGTRCSIVCRGTFASILSDFIILQEFSERKRRFSGRWRAWCLTTIPVAGGSVGLHSNISSYTLIFQK